MDAGNFLSSLDALAKEQQKLSDLAASLASQAGAVVHQNAGMAGQGFFMTGLTIFLLACFVGYYVVWNVTPALHSPLMAVTNAVSSVIIVGALVAAGAADLAGSQILGVVAVALAGVNIFGGFIVTQRMLEMYKKKDR